MQTQVVMERYRTLKGEGLSGLEASAQTRREFEGRGQKHWHRLYERCWCGFLTVPSQYYKYDDKGNQVNSQEDAEKAYLEEIDGVSRGQPREPNGESVRETPARSQAGEAQAEAPSVTGTQEKTCNSCNKPVTGWGKTCNACRQRAYRERSK